MILLIISYHYYTHYKNLKKEIYLLVQSQAESIAKRFEISATKLYRSNRFIKTIIKNNLHSQAKFIDLLNSVEEFKEDELEEFAKETNLSLILIVSYKNKKILKYNSKDISTAYIIKMLTDTFDDRLIFDSKNNLIYYIYKGKYSKNYIVTGIIAKKFFKKQRRFTTENLIKSIIKSRKGILDIKILDIPVEKLNISLKNNKYFEVKLPFHGAPDKSLKILIDATHGVKIINNFKHNLTIFVLFIFFTGIIVNFIIYLIQKKYIASINEYEKKLFIQEKDAALGRSAGLIAHEIRNPVNAVSIGLQRLQFETDLDDEYLKLIETMISELKKINKSIETFIDYTKPLTLSKEKLELRKIISDILTLYKSSNVNFKLDIPDNFIINADKKLFTQAVLNLITNAVENKGSTYVKIYIENNYLIFENNGVDTSVEPSKIFEPYYTQKTKGSGLGLAIVKKIVESHGWEIFCEIKNDVIKFKLRVD